MTPTPGGSPAPDVGRWTFRAAARKAADDHVRPALTAYRTMLDEEVLPAARDDDHPGLCHLPDGGSMYRALARLTARRTPHPTDSTPWDGVVERVRAELVATGAGLFGTSDLAEIFRHLSDDPGQRYGSREEMLDHARRIVASAEAAAPDWFTTVPDGPCSVEPVPGPEEAGAAPAYYLPGSVDGRVGARTTSHWNRPSGTGTWPRTWRSTRPCPDTTSS